jgi:hypothetical protein
VLVAMLLGGATQVHAHVASPPATYGFGLSLATGQNGQLFTLFIVKVYEGNILESTPLSREQFIRQVQGRTFSKANTDAEDLFRKYGVAACTLPADSAAMGYLTDCLTLDNLWKLRFWEYPYAVADGARTGKGWAEKPTIPGERQFEVLSDYGITHTTALCYGENMFRLLRDMGDPVWVDNYRKSD